MHKTIYSDGQEKLQKLLRNLRTKKGYRQEDLAVLLEVPQSFVSKYEAGERRLDILELREICKVLGIRFPEFVRKLEKVLDEA